MPLLKNLEIVYTFSHPVMDRRESSIPDFVPNAQELEISGMLVSSMVTILAAVPEHVVITFIDSDAESRRPALVTEQEKLNARPPGREDDPDCYNWEYVDYEDYEEDDGGCVEGWRDRSNDKAFYGDKVVELVDENEDDVPKLPVLWHPQSGSFKLAHKDDFTEEVHRRMKWQNSFYEHQYGLARPVDLDIIARVYDRFKVLQGMDLRAGDI